MKIAITGGAGFIGTQLADILIKDGHDVALIDIVPSSKYPDHSVIVDVTDKHALVAAMAGVDVIYHLAAEHRDDVSPVSKYYNVNVGGARNVIAAAMAHDIQTIIFTSSVAVYPLEPEDEARGAAEIHAPAPFNNYGQSKLDSEVVFLKWANEDKINRKLVTIRLVATFGAGNRGNIYTLMKQITSGKFIMIGDGQNNKSIAYVANVSAFLKYTLTLKNGSHLYNYADKPDLKMGDFVKYVRNALGREGEGFKLPYLLGITGGAVFDVVANITGQKFPISKIRVQKFCANTIVNADKAHATEFTPPFTLQQGLQDMIEAEFKNNPKNAT